MRIPGLIPGRTLASALLLLPLLLLACGGGDAAQEAGGDAPAPTAGALEGQVILVTGSTDGLGREVALELATRGAHVIIHGRNEERGGEVVRAIQAEGMGSASFYRADFASFQEVRELADRILADHDRLDVLVHNAGLGRGPPESGREESLDGHELRFQVNYLATVLLTDRLLPLLRASAPSRIVNVASVGQQPIDFDDVMLEREYEGGRAYAQSKLAQILYTFDLAEELEGSGVTVNALHPASGMPTNMLRVAERPVRSTVEEGVAAVLQLVLSPDVGSGRYYNGLELGEPNDQAFDREARARLRALSREWVGLD